MTITAKLARLNKRREELKKVPQKEKQYDKKSKLARTMDFNEALEKRKLQEWAKSFSYKNKYWQVYEKRSKKESRLLDRLEKAEAAEETKKILEKKLPSDVAESIMSYVFNS